MPPYKIRRVKCQVEDLLQAMQTAPSTDAAPTNVVIMAIQSGGRELTGMLERLEARLDEVVAEIREAVQQLEQKRVQIRAERAQDGSKVNTDKMAKLAVHGVQAVEALYPLAWHLAFLLSETIVKECTANLVTNYIDARRNIDSNFRLGISRDEFLSAVEREMKSRAEKR